jgi:hypothetical protein
LILRSATFDVFTRFNWGDLVPAAIVAATITLVNLSAIWLSLGMCWTRARVTTALALLVLSPVALELYSGWITSTRYTLIRNIVILVGRHNNWAMWICLNMAMLAALLLFLRASGFRLRKEKLVVQSLPIALLE